MRGMLVVALILVQSPTPVRSEPSGVPGGRRVAAAAPEGDSCPRACERLHGLAWRRLVMKELETSEKAVKDLERRRGAAREKGADQTCLAACKAGKIETACVMRATGVGMDQRDIDEGAPNCVRDKKLVSLFDEAVLAEERATAAGSCDSVDASGLCIDFKEEARYGRIGKGASCYVMTAGKLKTARCPTERLLGTCAYPGEGQEEHFYAAGSSYKSEGPTWADSFKASCELGKQQWIKPGK